MTMELLTRCEALGIRLAADGDNLAVDAPAGSLTPKLLDEIRDNKPALLAALTEPTGDVTTTTKPESAPEPRTATRGEGEPEAVDVQTDADMAVHPLDTWLEAEDLGRWTHQGGRLTGPDADGGDDWDSLPEPGKPCPVCGSLDVLWNLLGVPTCQRCHPEKLERSRRLAEKAQRLRQKSRTT